MSDDQQTVGASSADEARNRTFGAGLVDDPYPRFHELRAECPVHAGTIASKFDAMRDAGGAVGVGDAIVHSTYGYETALDVLRRFDDFSSRRFMDMSLNLMIGPSVIGMDEPEHRRMRNLFQPAFARREMQEWKARIIQPIVDEHLDRIAPLGRADLYKEIAATVPVHTISAALGLPIEDRDTFFGWSIAMTSTVNPPAERVAASQAVADYVAPIIAARRRSPQNDLLSTLVSATVPADAGSDDVRPLTDAEINTFVRLFIIAGAGTTYRAYGNIMFHLLANPDQLAEVRADRSLMRGAIDEGMRIDQSLAYLGRGVTRDCELDGVALPEGSFVEISVSAANHDPVAFPDPERFDIRREKADRHVSFGFGIHRCLGAHLAEAELEVMIGRTLDRLANVRFDPDATDVRMTGVGFRLPTGLPVVYDPEPAA